MAVGNLVLGSQWIDAQRSDVGLWFYDDIDGCMTRRCGVEKPTSFTHQNDDLYSNDEASLHSHA